MNLRLLAATLFAALTGCVTATVDHDKLKPFPQPEPVTVSGKAVIKFKPQLDTPDIVCVLFPAVNSAGETTSRLKGTKGNDTCKYAPKGSQIYGRSGWYKYLWAIMYVWYFPKGFSGMGFPTRLHDWKSVEVWIDNPAMEIPKFVGVSLSKTVSIYFSGYRVQGSRFHHTYTYGSNTSLRFQYLLDVTTYMKFGYRDGGYQDLIMLQQLTDTARVALNDSNSFGKAEVPFSDEHDQGHLDNAWLP